MVREDWAQLLIKDPERLRKKPVLEMTKLNLADDFALLAMNGEIVVDYGLFIREQSGGTVLPMGYSNGMIGYIPTAKQLAEGGYESIDAIYPFALPSPFHPVLEEMICHHLLKLIGK